MKAPVLVPLVLVVSLTAGCGAGGPEDESPSRMSLTGRSADTDNSPSTHVGSNYLQATDDVESLGRSTYKDIYAGMVVNDRGVASSLQVYLTRESSAAEADFDRAAGSVPILFRRAPQSQEFLEELEARLGDATPGLWKHGVRITASWPHLQTGRLHVEVVHLERGDRARIQAAIGSDLVDVVNTNEFVVGTATRGHRTTSP